MYDVLLTPVVTIPVIVALAITIVAQGYFDARRMKARLRAQAGRLGKMTAMLLAATEVVHKRDSERQIGHAIEATITALEEVGFDKLASGEVTFEGVMFGETKDGPFRRKSFRDPLASFSMDDLKEALRPEGDGGTVLRPGEGPNGEKYAGGGPGIRTGGDPFAGEGNGGSKGPRPYHKATDFDLSGRSPRAG